MGIWPVGVFSVGLMLTGCATTEPVAEYHTYRYYEERPRTVVVEPVGESYETPRYRPAQSDSRYYNAITRSWERPWPYGPANATSPGYW